MLNRVPNIFLIILLIPIINVSAAILTPLFPPRALNPGVIRGLFLTVFTIWFLFTQYKSNVFGKITIAFLVYIFTLCWLSDDFNTSIYIFNKVYIASILLLIGYHYVRNPIRFLLFQRAFLVSLFLLELYVISANIFGWGFATYKDDSVFFGETGVNITKYIVIFVIGIPLYLKTEKDKQYRNLAIVLLFIGVIITFIGMKRSAILALGFGFVMYSFLTPYKTRLVRSLPLIIVVIFITSPFYLPIILKRFESREKKVSMTYANLTQSETEGRVVEVKLTINETFNAGLDRLLFGYNVFLKKNYLGHKRMLHVDYMNMLGGAGIIGLFLFIFSYFKIYQFINRIYREMKKYKYIKELFATAVSLIAVQGLLSIGGTMQGLDLRGAILMNLGALASISSYYYLYPNNLEYD